MNHFTRHRLACFAVLSALALVLRSGSVAEACATFGLASDPTSAPSLSLERVLIVHDPAAQLEHFIREVVFAGDSKVFGFVVPTPTRPEVFAVTDAPFDRLEYTFPFAPRPKLVERAPRNTRGYELSDDMAAVQVIEKKAVGSFTAFVLRASDASALATWLRDNQLGSTAQNDAWLASYVARDFYYVAMRYEPKPGAALGKLESETMRISFQSPLAYYPYQEPLQSKPNPAARAIALWVVAPEPLVPIAYDQRRGCEGAWSRPFQAGAIAEGITGKALRHQLGASEIRLVEADRSLVVQTFEDQKKSREGLGDVVWLPARGVAGAARGGAAAFLARVRGGEVDTGSLLGGGDALRKLTLRATDKGAAFNPKLRAKLTAKPAPVRTKPSGHVLSDDF